MKETGNDPFHIANQAAQQQQQAAQQQQQAQQSTSGSAVKGAVGGALAERSSVRLPATPARARRSARAWARSVIARGPQSQANQASQQAAQQAQAAAHTSAAQMNDFKKAFSACLEAKKYTVKY